jgi:hypothetical protein
MIFIKMMVIMFSILNRRLLQSFGFKYLGAYGLGVSYPVSTDSEKHGQTHE